MAAQVAGTIGDRAFGERVLDLMREHNPAAVPLARILSERRVRLLEAVVVQRVWDPAIF